MSLEIVLGPMFSGKSSYALSYARRQRAIGKKVLVIKPDIDLRYSEDSYMVTHDNDKLECMMWKTTEPLCQIDHILLNLYDCFVVEEAQFFNHLDHFCTFGLLHLKKNILVVGLDGCAKQKPFGDISKIIPLATSLTKLSALCCFCRDGTAAPYTKKLADTNDETQVDVGGADKYVAVCLNHLVNDE